MRQQRSFVRVLLSRAEGWFAVFCTIFALTILTGLFTQIRDAQRLATDGASTVGNVTDLQLSGGEGVARHIVTFAFMVEGNRVEESSVVSSDVFDSLQQGDRVSVRYWREDPTVADLEPVAARPYATFSTIFFIAFSVLCAGLAVLGFKETAWIYWLSRNGVPVQATLTGKEETDDGETVSWRATWIEPSGRTGTTARRSRDTLPAIGTPITVLTDPTGRRAGLWEADL